jgi:hypothetical protein
MNRSAGAAPATSSPVEPVDDETRDHAAALARTEADVR